MDTQGNEIHLCMEIFMPPMVDSLAGQKFACFQEFLPENVKCLTIRDADLR